MFCIQSISRQTLNTFYLGLCFAVLFSSYDGLSNIQKLLQLSIHEDNPNYNVDGWTSLGILYTVFGFSLWLSPSIISITGTKLAMIAGSIGYLLSIMSYFLEASAATYAGTVILGIGASLLWTSQADYVVMNSEIGQVSKSISLFWMLYQSSNFPGNILIYLRLHDTKKMDTETRMMILFGVGALTAISVVMLCFLGKPVRKEPTDSPLNTKKDGPIESLRRAWSIAKTSNMIILVIAFIYTGIHLTYVHVIASSIGFSTYLPDREELVPLAGIYRGAGAVIGGLFAQFLGRKVFWKVKPVITGAVTVNLTCYIISFIGLANNSPSGESFLSPILQLPATLLLFASLLAGMGDACMHSELYDIVGGLFPYNGAASFAVFKFVRSLSTGASFFYSNTFGLYTQLVILTSCCLLSLMAVHFVANRQSKRGSYDAK